MHKYFYYFSFIIMSCLFSYGQEPLSKEVYELYKRWRKIQKSELIPDQALIDKSTFIKRNTKIEKGEIVLVLRKNGWRYGIVDNPSTPQGAISVIVEITPNSPTTSKIRRKFFFRYSTDNMFRIGKLKKEYIPLEIQKLLEIKRRA